MEKLAYYVRYELPWDDDEDEQIRNEYIKEGFDIVTIGYIHKRTPGQIACRLRKLSIINITVEARGYADYILSDLYKEIVYTSRERAVKRKEQKEQEKLVKTEEKRIKMEEAKRLKEEVKLAKAMENRIKMEEETKQKEEHNVLIEPVRGIYGLDKNKYPLRMGASWVEEEVVKLLKLVQKKKNVTEIAKIHQRTEGGISAKLRSLAVDYYIYDKRNIEQIQLFTGLSKKTILDAIKRRGYPIDNNAVSEQELDLTNDEEHKNKDMPSEIENIIVSEQEINLISDQTHKNTKSSTNIEKDVNKLKEEFVVLKSSLKQIQHLLQTVSSFEIRPTQIQNRSKINNKTIAKKGNLVNLLLSDD